MSDTIVFATATHGQHVDDDGHLFEWRLVADSDGLQVLHVSRFGGRSLMWTAGEPMPPGPAETRLAALQIALHVRMAGDARRFVPVQTNDYSSGEPRTLVLDTQARTPSQVEVCRTSQQWAPTIARALNGARLPDPDDVPFDRGR